MKTKLKTIVCLSLFLALPGLSAFTQTWDMTADWNPPANPNGAWSYGEINGGVFTPLAWTQVSGQPNVTGVYGSGIYGVPFVYQNTAAEEYYGINPGQISIEADWGDAAVQWTAPTSGDYSLAVYIGGPTGGGLPLGPGGYANTYAQWAGLNINGVSQTDTAFVNNASEIMKSWLITNLSLSAGDTVEAYVLNPGYADGGNTQAKFTITKVPTTVAPPYLNLSLAVSIYEQNTNVPSRGFTTTANPLARRLATADVLTLLAFDEHAEGNWASNSFPKGSTLAIGDGGFGVLKGTNVLVDVSDIISFTTNQPAIHYGKLNNSTGLASPSEYTQEIGSLSFNDASIAGGKNVQFYLTGIVTQTRTDLVPVRGKDRETLSLGMSNGVGSGYWQNTAFICTGSFTATESSFVTP
jgi:hypothetical protein